jgi:TonB family protein
MKMVGFLFILFVSLSATAEDPEPLLRTAPMPFYPAAARSARVQGEVDLVAKINQDGEVIAVEATDGHPLLKFAAVANVKNWKFDCSPRFSCNAERKITFVYQMSDRSEDAGSPAATVRWFGIVRVEIETDGPTIVVTNSDL